MTKFLVISDIHLDAPSDPESNDLMLFDMTADWFANLIRLHEPDFVINAGDTNHRDGGMSVGTIRLFRRFFDVIAAAVDDVATSKPCKLLTIPGNHDQHNVDGTAHVMEPLKWLMNSQVIEEATLFQHEGLNFILAPFRRDLVEYQSTLLRPKMDGSDKSSWHFEPDLIFTHMDIRDCVMNSGMKSTKGVDGGFFKVPVFNGHYHLPQTYGNVKVIGAPQYRTFRDFDPPGTPARGALLITAEKEREVTFGKLTTAIKVERFQNPWTNVFNTFKGDTKEELELQASIWCRELFKRYGSDLNDDRIHIRFVGPSTELDKLKKSKKWDKFRVVQFLPADSIVAEEETISLDLQPSAAVQQYFEATKCSCGTQHTVSIGQKAIEQAQQEASTSIGSRKVQFESLYIKDFRSIGEATVDLSDPGLTLIEGVNKDEPTADSNGAGKSSIAEALVWCLFDDTSKGISKDRIIRNGSETAVAALTLKVDGTAYVITRSRSKGKPSVQITRAGEDITPHDNRKATEKITQIVGVNMEQFLLTTVLAQGFGMKFTSFNDSARKELLESFLGLEVYDLAAKLVQQQIKAVDAKQKALADEMLQLESSKSTTQSHIKSLKEKKMAASLANVGELDEIIKAINEYDEEIPKWEQLLEERQQEIHDLQVILNDIEKQWNALSSESAKTDKAIALRKADLLRWQDDLRELMHEPNTTCPTCEQRLPADRAEALKAMRDSKVADVTAACKMAEAAIEVNRETQVKQVAQASTLRNEKNNLSIKTEGLSVEYNEWNATYREQKAERVARIKQKQRIEVDKNQFDSLITEAESKIIDLDTKLNGIAATSESLDKERHQLDFWVKAFHPTGIRSVLLRSVVNYLNEHLRSLSAVLTGGGFGVSVSSTTELKSKKDSVVNKLDICITPDRQYEELSGGEQRKVDLALNMAVALLAQQTCGFSSNLLIADEVLDTLDLTASRAVLDMFSSFRDRSVFLISHNVSVKSLIPRCITVVKKNGVTEVL